MASTFAPAEPILSLTAGDLMTTPVMSIPQEMPLCEAARLLCRSEISGAPVMDAEGRCLGVLSAKDFVTWAGAEGEMISFIAPWGEMINITDSPDNQIRHYMTSQVVAAEPSTPIGELARMMIEAHIHRLLVVVDGGRPVGIVTSTDILTAIARAAQYSKKRRREPRSGSKQPREHSPRPR